MNPKSKINKISNVENKEILINQEDRNTLLKLKKSTDTKRLKQLESSNEKLIVTEKFAESLDNEGFVDFNQLKNSLSLIYDIKKIHLYSIESGILSFSNGDFMTNKGLTKLEKNYSELNKENAIINQGQDHYILLGNQILVINGKEKNKPEITQALLKIFRGSICIISKNIVDNQFKKS